SMWARRLRRSLWTVLSSSPWPPLGSPGSGREHLVDVDVAPVVCLLRRHTTRQVERGSFVKAFRPVRVSSRFDRLGERFPAAEVLENIAVHLNVDVEPAPPLGV